MIFCIVTCALLPRHLYCLFSEFDQFLAERAREADNLPDLNPNDRSQQQRGGRQMQKDDAENALFAL